MSVEILSITANLDKYGGAQKVLMNVHEGIRDKYNAKVLGFQKYKDLHPKYNIVGSEYVQFNNPFYLNNKILIVHARNVMAYIMVLKRVFFLNTKIMYVAHNVYSNYKWASFFPDTIISISEKVTDNLINYFNLKKSNIKLIYNGIKDESKDNFKLLYRNDNKIIILYSARVNEVKRQIEIINNLTNKLFPEIEILFAGAGPDYSHLVEKCNQTINFKALGFIEDMSEIIRDTDYLMLFSKQEGLPISLIEGTMLGKPLLINDVGGNIEIGVPGVNGILLDDDWESLADKLNNLVTLRQAEYLEMSLNSRKRYESMFTYENMILNYLDVIKQMI